MEDQSNMENENNTGLKWEKMLIINPIQYTRKYFPKRLGLIMPYKASGPGGIHYQKRT